MELNEKQIERIDNFLQGRLSGDELLTFESELEENTLLKEELAIRKAIQDGIEHKNNVALRARLNKISEETKSETKEETKLTPKNTKVVSINYFRYIASIAAIGLLCFFAYNLLDGGADTDTLYASYFEPAELTITRSTDIETEMVDLKEFYNTKKYDKALPLFQSLINENQTSNFKLAYGSTLLKCNKLAEAKSQFQSIINANDPLYADQARWYLGLVELKSGNVDACKSYLNDLASDTGSDNHDQAKALLQELSDLN